jgi:SAM-dependent methyltransferase
MRTKQISKLDLDHYKKIRKDVSAFLKKVGKKYDTSGLLLDIAPQVHEGASPYFKKIQIKTLDIDPKSKADYIVDICQTNKEIIPDNTFDMIVCTEVLEHTTNPFTAVDEIYRILKPGGLVFITVPFDFRIHGPLPDCWRFTEHGLRALLKKFELVKLQALENDKRWLMPIHYSAIVRK